MATRGQRGHHSRISVSPTPEFPSNSFMMGLSSWESDCRMLAILRLDFSAINKSEFPKLRSPAGEKYFRINFNLVMTFGTMIAFKLEYKGQVRGDVTAEYIEAMPMQADSCP